jgi:hypothetical protein
MRKDTELTISSRRMKGTKESLQLMSSLIKDWSIYQKKYSRQGATFHCEGQEDLEMWRAGSIVPVFASESSSLNKDTEVWSFFTVFHSKSFYHKYCPQFAFWYGRNSVFGFSFRYDISKDFKKGSCLIFASIFFSKFIKKITKIVTHSQNSLNSITKTLNCKCDIK